MVEASCPIVRGFHISPYDFGRHNTIQFAPLFLCKASTLPAATVKTLAIRHLG